MRKLMWFSIGFAAACAAGYLLLAAIWMLIAAGCCLAAGIAFCFVKTNWGKRLAAALLGCCAAFAWNYGYDLVYLQPAKAMDGQVLHTTVTITDYSEESDYGARADASLELDGKPYRVRLYLQENDSYAPADQITGRFLLRYTAAGGEDPNAYYQGKGVFLTVKCQEISAYRKAETMPVSLYPAYLRQQIKDLLFKTFPEDAAPLARALLLGDRSQLDYETQRNLQTSGISHVVAVSGLHVSILFSLIYPLCGRKRWLTAMIGIPVLILFAAVAGFTASVVRACLMQCLMILALLVDREYDPPTALGFAVLVLLLANPSVIADISFQLSVSCMAGIFLFGPPILAYLTDPKRLGKYKGKNWKARICRGAAAAISTTISACVFTIPLCAIHFGVVSVVSLLTNLLVLWVVSALFYGIMAACILGAIWLPLGQGIGWLMAWLVRYILAVSDTFGGFTLSAVYTQSIYILCWLIFSYLLLLGFYIWGKKHMPSAFSAVAAGLVLAVAVSWIEPRLDTTRVTVLDVQQGQCILLQSAGERFLVDCGSETRNKTDDVVNYLHSQGIFRLDGVILTHYDWDHAGGVLDLLTQVEADVVYLPDIYDDQGVRLQIQQQYPDSVYWVSEDVKILLSQGAITLYTSENAENDNESSLCALFQS